MRSRINRILIFGFIGLFIFIYLPVKLYAQSDGYFKISVLDSVLTSSESDVGDVSNCFDGDPNTIMRSAEINPAFVQVAFPTQQAVTQVRVLLGQPGFPNIDKNSWWVEAADTQEDLDSKTGSYQVVVPERFDVAGTWDTGVLSEAVINKRIWRFWINRTVGDDYVHIPELELYTSSDIEDMYLELNSLVLDEGWRWVHNGYVQVKTTDGQHVPLTHQDVTYSSSDTSVVTIDANGTITAVGKGMATISATYQGFQDDIQEVEVKGPFLPTVYENIDPYLTTPAANYLYEVPVVIIRYLPTSNGIDLDVNYAPGNFGLESMRLDEMTAWVDARDKRIKFAMEERSRFRGYKDPAAPPSLGYRVVEYITVYEQTPPGENYYTRTKDGKTYKVFWPDYHQIFERFNLAHYVNDLGVKEIWIWNNQLSPEIPSFDSARHRPEHFRGTHESNMSSKIGTNKNVENSAYTAGDDLPKYNSTYTVFDMNLRRSGDLMVHSHGHQIEKLIDYFNETQIGNTHLFRRKFIGHDDNDNPITGRCGWTHWGPNTTENYNVTDPTLVESDCEDWTPDRIGQTKLVNVHTWGNLLYDWPDGAPDYGLKVQYQWYIYWAQNLPGYGNMIEYDTDNYMTNWWEFTAHFDMAVESNLGVYGPLPMPSVIPQGQMAVVSASSDAGNTAKVLDGNSNTRWQAYDPSGLAPPHEMIIALGGTYNVSEFRYLPFSWKKCTQYEVYVSATNGNWGSPVASGTWANDSTEKTVRFPPTPGAYLRIRYLDNYCYAAEHNVVGVADTGGGGNAAPTITSNGGGQAAAISVPENQTAVTTVIATDPDIPPDPALAYSLSGGADQPAFSIGAGNGVLTFNAAPDFENPTDAGGNNVYDVIVQVVDGQGGQDTQALAVTVTGAPSVIPQGQMTVVSASSDAGNIAKVLDGNSNTRWQAYDPSGLAPPHEMIIALGGTYNVSEFRYLPFSWKKCTQVEVYVSATNGNWGSPVASGTWANDPTEKTVSFPPTSGAYLRIRYLDNYCYAAEHNVVGVATGNPPPPPIPLGILPTIATVPVGGQKAFTATGGVLSYLYSVLPGDTTGGASINASTGLYTAGPLEGTSTVRVTDATLATTDAAVTVTGATSVIPQGQMTIVSASSDAENTAKVLDGNSMTRWGPSGGGPHDMILALGGTYNVSEFRYLPFSWTKCTQYEVYVSETNGSWGTAVATGTWANDSTEKTASFPPTPGAFLRIRYLNSYCYAAEHNVVGAVMSGGI